MLKWLNNKYEFIEIKWNKYYVDMLLVQCNDLMQCSMNGLMPKHKWIIKCITYVEC